MWCSFTIVKIPIQSSNAIVRYLHVNVHIWGPRVGHYPSGETDHLQNDNGQHAGFVDLITVLHKRGSGLWSGCLACIKCTSAISRKGWWARPDEPLSACQNASASASVAGQTNLSSEKDVFIWKVSPVSGRHLKILAKNVIIYKLKYLEARGCVGQWRNKHMRCVGKSFKP